TFVGWSETGKEKDLWNFAAQPMPAKDVTLHAVWKLDFTTRKTQDGGIELVNYTGDKTVIQIPDVIDGKKVVSIADDCFPDETVTLTGNSGSAADEWAKKKGMEFVPLKYTVTFIPGGGTQPPALTLSVGQKVPAPETFREGYILNGWYTDQYFGGRFDFENDLMPQHDLALYALWTKEADADEIPFTYEEEETGLIITGYIGAPGAAVIPESINGMPVAAIAPYAFYEEENLYGLTVPGSVKTIGECALSGSAVTFVEVKNGVEVIESLAFADCAQLTSLKLPDSVHTLGNHALQGLSALTSIAIPEGVTVLYEGLLNGCTFLSSVSLPSKLESIGAKAFAECPLLKTIEIPSSVTFVDNSAFKGCKALEKIVSEGTHFRSADGVLLSSDGKTLVCNVDGTKEKFLCGSDKDIAGANDFVDLRNCLCAVRESRDCLSAAHKEHSVNARELCSGNDIGIRSAVLLRRSYHDKLLNARKLRGNRIHQYR
ncbi:MAG: leucine-rich repeat protein, partial [Ruminococcus sp.]|nr:leucine-rich repeat protein [Ruminococcus sp.]